MDRLKDKVAIITGSTGGIGVGIARLYAAEGAQVIVCGRRAERGQGVVDAITAEGGKASFHAMDITVPESIEKLVEDTVSTYGRIDVLVNNAANVGLKDGRVDEITLEMWDDIFISDIRGPFYVTKCVLPHMRKNPQGGSIVNIGSMAACGGDLGSTAYACAKAGVDVLTKSVALQYGKDNIRCNCVRPGLIVTPDNGTLTHVRRKSGITGVRIIDETRNRLAGSEQSYTFYGRDVYAYTGARLAAGAITFEAVGPAAEPDSIIELPITEARRQGERVEGTIDVLDVRFGSLWTNISRELFRTLGIQFGQRAELTITNDTRTVYRNTMIYAQSFSGVFVGEPLLYVNSLDCMAVAINQGSFAKAYNIGVGNSWKIAVGPDTRR